MPRYKIMFCRRPTPPPVMSRLTSQGTGLVRYVATAGRVPSARDAAWQQGAAMLLAYGLGCLLVDPSQAARALAAASRSSRLPTGRRRYQCPHGAWLHQTKIVETTSMKVR